MQLHKNTLQKIPKKMLIGGSIGLGILCIAGGYFLFGQLQPKAADPSSPPPVPKKVASLLETVAKKIELPQSEPPTVATVDDPQKLQDQIFFAKAKKGDKILMFIEAQKAYIYRPSTDEIIESGPIKIVDEESDASESAVLAASSSAEPTGDPVLRIKF